MNEFGYDSSDNQARIVMWSPTGPLAVARERTLPVLDARNSGTISRALCFTPFESETTTVSSRMRKWYNPVSLSGSFNFREDRYL